MLVGADVAGGVLLAACRLIMLTIPNCTHIAIIVTSIPISTHHHPIIILLTAPPLLITVIKTPNRNLLGRHPVITHRHRIIRGREGLLRGAVVIVWGGL